MEKLLSSELDEKPEKSSTKVEKSSSSSSSEQGIIVFSDPTGPEHSSKGSQSSESSDSSEDSEAEQAIVFRDSEYALPPVKVDEDPKKYLNDASNKKNYEETKVRDEEFTEIRIEDISTKQIVPENLHTSSDDKLTNKEKVLKGKIEVNQEVLVASYSGGELRENDADDVKIRKIEETEVNNSGQGRKESESSSSSSSSSEKDPQNILIVTETKIETEYPPSDPALNILNTEEAIEIKEDSISYSNPSKDLHPHINPTFSSSNSSSKSEEDEIHPLPLTDPEDRRKDHKFADISSIDIYGSTHFVNVNDKSDYSIEVSHSAIEFDDDLGRKSSIRPKDESFSGSEEETLQELKVLEHALHHKDQESSGYSDKERPSEMDEAVVIDNSEIQARDSSDSSGDEIEILKRIQTEPSELNEVNYKDEEIYQKIQDPPFEKITGVEKSDKLEEKKEILQERKSVSSSSSSSDDKVSGIVEKNEEKHVEVNVHEGNQEIRVEEVKITEEVVIREEVKIQGGNEIRVEEVTIREEVKIKEEVKSKDEGRNGKGEVGKNEEVYKRPEKEMLENSLVDAKRNETETKKRSRDQKANTACSNCAVF